MERTATSIKFISSVTIFCILTFVLQHSVIYKQFIIPQLPSIKSVPLLWWAGYLLPTTLVLVWAGYLSKNRKEIMVTSATVSVAYNLFVYSLVRFNEPGFLKSYEGAFLPDFTKGIIIYAIIYVIILSAGYSTNKFILTNRNNSING